MQQYVTGQKRVNKEKDRDIGLTIAPWIVTFPSIYKYRYKRLRFLRRWLRRG